MPGLDREHGDQRQETVVERAEHQGGDERQRREADGAKARPHGGSRVDASADLGREDEQRREKEARAAEEARRHAVAAEKGDGRRRQRRADGKDRGVDGNRGRPALDGHAGDDDVFDVGDERADAERADEARHGDRLDALDERRGGERKSGDQAAERERAGGAEPVQDRDRDAGRDDDAERLRRRAEPDRRTGEAALLEPEIEELDRVAAAEAGEEHDAVEAEDRRPARRGCVAGALARAVQDLDALRQHPPGHACEVASRARPRAPSVARMNGNSGNPFVQIRPIGLAKNQPCAALKWRR